ncbi:MAG: type II toxin-antitoxin system HicA family toxin [Spirochaetia bacterium]|jgi:predicted RNA binding protein YcfA (HicA-like mRNA interferase family)|nr:type II toxin-antitoxin system HicA family toxin [Spirochaetia bacterium]
MSNFPALSGKKVIKILEKFNFEIVRTKGSHYFLRHSNGRSTTVPVHSNESIGIGLLLQILKDCEIDKKDFLKMI